MAVSAVNARIAAAIQHVAGAVTDDAEFTVVLGPRGLKRAGLCGVRSWLSCDGPFPNMQVLRSVHILKGGQMSGLETQPRGRLRGADEHLARAPGDVVEQLRQAGILDAGIISESDTVLTVAQATEILAKVLDESI